MVKKGSHLKRFKESLSKITKPDHRKKIRKSIPERDPDRAEKLKRIEEQFNAFDTKFTRSKHDVLGRKVKGKTGKPGISRERGEQEVTPVLPTMSYFVEEKCVDEGT
jgi:nucleolar protein 14